MNGLDAEASSKVLNGIALIVGFDVLLIPRKPKRCAGNLDHEKSKSVLGGKRVAKMSMSSAVPVDVTVT